MVSSFKSRRWIGALFAALFAIFAFIMFCHYIKEPNSGLILTVVCAPCLAIVGVVTTGQSFIDHKFGETGQYAPNNKQDQ
jgi:uncharacterized membrane protein HdeD (DUF308 family)